MLVRYGIVPPLRFADGKELYWPVNAAPAKAQVRSVLSHLARTDEPRRDEWSAALAKL
jgi:hypothetical protein